LRHDAYPTTAQQCRPETEKNILEVFFSLALLHFKKYQPSRNLKFYNVALFLKLAIAYFSGTNSSNFS